MDLAEQLAVFAEKGNQQRIHLTDGRTLQGWIMEIREDDLLMSTGFLKNKAKTTGFLLHQSILISCNIGIPSSPSGRHSRLIHNKEEPTQNIRSVLS